MIRPSRFDLTVGAVAGALLALIALTVAFGAPTEVGLQVAYLYPASGPFNIYLVDPEDPTTSRRVTDLSGGVGVYDYDPAPDGRGIVYAEQDPQLGTAELYWLPLNGTGQATPQALTNCRAEDADCVAPKWRPGSTPDRGFGGVIAYQRRGLNSELGLGTSPTRLWILDLNTSPPSTYPLFDDSQILGSDQVWSSDGSRLGFYEGFGRNIIVYDFAATSDETRLRTLPSTHGATGALSPDGRLMVYPQVILPSEDAPATTLLNIADLETAVFRPLTPDDPLVSDGALPAWHPDGTRIAFTRKYLDDRITLGEQVYLYDVASGAVTRLVYDENYTHGALSWSPDGERLLMQRFNYRTSLPEIWMYSVRDGRLTLLSENAWYARWVPAPG